MSALTDARRLYARLMAAHAGSADPRLEEIVASVPRENFLGPGPWTIIAGPHGVRTPNADPVHLYQNVLVSLDAEKGINNGEPFLHALWIGKVAPKPGEAVIHVGAGSGYYTAILSRLVLPGGTVTAFELDDDLAARARQNLAPYANVEVVHGNAVTASLAPADIVYVNAGVVAPPLAWLDALKAGGRLVFPWRPAEHIGLAVMVTRTGEGFACDPFSRSWFIPCVGAALAEPATKTPADLRQAARSRSIRLTAEAEPDATATAVYPHLWFSARGVEDEPR